MRRNSVQRQNTAPALIERSDEELLSSFVGTHDEAAFAAIVERHKQMVWNVCWKVLHHWQDTEGARQQAFMVLIRKAESIRDGEALASWLWGVAFRKARNMLTIRRRRQAHADACVTTQLAHAPDGAEYRETLGIINTQVQRLSEKVRIPFVLHCLEGKSKREVAEELGLPEGTVASRVRQARKHLQRRLGQCGVALPSKS